MKRAISAWPDVDGSAVASCLQQVDRSHYPELDRYSREEIYREIQGEGGLFLAAEMARELDLKPGGKVLDLACGAGQTSIYLAKQHGVEVFAVDRCADPSALVQASAAAGVGALVHPLKMDARELSFADGFFDAVFCLNSYFYFGTDDLFLPYLLRFVRDRARICIASPCYREEISPYTPDEFLIEFPDCLAVHSPAWWRTHFEKTRGVELLRCEAHPHSRAFWEDFVRLQVEREEPRTMSKPKADSILGFLKVLDLDGSGFLSHLFLLAEKRPGIRFGASLDWYRAS